MMKKILLIAILTGVHCLLKAQSTTIGTNLINQKKLEWDKPISFTDFSEKEITLLNFKNATYNFPNDSLPLFAEPIYLPQNADDARVSVVVLASEPLNTDDKLALINSKIGYKIDPEITVSWYRKKPVALVSFHPIVRNSTTNQLEKITEFRYEITPQMTRSARSGRMDFKVNSVLRSGFWVKIGVTKDGIYRVGYEDMQSMGFDVSNLPSQNVRLFGNGGGFLPFDNSEFRWDDLEENAIEVVDGNDGIFNAGDYFLFYGQDPNRWKYANGRFNHVLNIFSDTTYYFITTEYQIGLPKRISASPAITDSPDITVDDFTDFQFHEVDLINFVKSGRNWYGEAFNFTKSRNYSFNFPNSIPNTGQIKSTVAFRVINKPANFTFTTNGTKILELNQPGISGTYYGIYAALVTQQSDFSVPSDNFTVAANFNNPSTSDNAWLDYIEVICDRKLQFSGTQMPFRNVASQSANVIQYSISNASGIQIWNVTTPTNVRKETIVNGNFKSKGGQINEFIAFSNSGFLSPKVFGKVANQDLHSIQWADYVIITHPDFLSQANQLANFHSTHSQLKTVVVTTQQVYNEFSSGAQDITAFKSFNKMLYDRAGNDESKMLKYVLLLGDASYDYKHRMPGNTNFVPAYQSWNSYHNLGSFVSDDYIGFLDDNESDELSSSLDVGIGRIMAQTPAQAQAVVDKTIHYMTNKNCMRPWRNLLTFVGDDEDGNLHMKQSDVLATKIDTGYPNYNINKIYLDAFQQVSNAGGSTYPDVNTALDQATERGSTIITYVGHGGELGLAHERILGLTQINNYSNFDALALYLTATCEFSRFDDPERTSAGEFTLLNPYGGAIALLTTTRLVYSSPNFELSKKFFDVVFEMVDGKRPRLGDLLRISKIGGSNINYRNFSLLGDPAAMLAYPTMNVETETRPDTIKSLEKVTISGIVTDQYGQKLTSYNGVVYPTIYGQRQVESTLNNDGTGVMTFETQTNALFKGKASVTGGDFEFSFVVPKDIDFNYGSGKISYYAENGTVDASGSDESFKIGGLSTNPANDTEGPTVELWLNDESFVPGGMTDENPLLLAKIYDDNGINTVGSGIGHDIVAVIDENTANSITLNDYYESELNSYQRGTVNYKLSNLPEGKHTLRVKAWDVYNNSGEAFTEFYVSKSGEFTIDRVLNYPNPFTTSTDFYFDHNAIGQQLQVRIQVFTISGKLVKTIDHIEQSDSYKVGPLNWDGRDDFGDRIGKGTYVYRVKVTNGYGQTVEKFEKIVIL